MPHKTVASWYLRLCSILDVWLYLVSRKYVPIFQLNQTEWGHFLGTPCSHYTWASAGFLNCIKDFNALSAAACLANFLDLDRVNTLTHYHDNKLQLLSWTASPSPPTQFNIHKMITDIISSQDHMTTLQCSKAEHCPDQVTTPRV